MIATTNSSTDTTIYRRYVHEGNSVLDNGLYKNDVPFLQKYDVLKALYEQGQRELESWKTKCERLDHALADVSRLVLFARNPPDSARSSQIM